MLPRVEMRKIMHTMNGYQKLGKIEKQSTKCRSKNESTQVTFHVLINVLRCRGKPKMDLKRVSRKNQDVNAKNRAQKTS